MAILSILHLYIYPIASRFTVNDHLGEAKAIINS